MVRIHSGVPVQTNLGIVPIFVPTLNVARLFHRRAPSIRVRVNVAPSGAEIAVPREVCQRVRVHVRRPLRKASVPEGVERPIEEIKYMFNHSHLFLEFTLFIPTELK